MARTPRRRSKDQFAAREARRYPKPIASREHLMKVLRENVGPLKSDEIAALVGVRGKSGLEALEKRLAAMLRAGQLVMNRRGGYMVVDERELYRGRISANRDGYGFLLGEEGGEDIYLSPRQMRSVWHGDRAVVRVTGVDRRGRAEGRLIEVLERSRDEIVGRLHHEGGLYYVIPEDRRLQHTVLVPGEDVGGARNQQIVVVAIVEQPDHNNQPIGRVEEVLGERTQPGMEVDIAIHNHGIPYRWPQGVETQARKLPGAPVKRDLQGRVDCTDLPFVTIDGDDAKDFDDAVFCEPLEHGWRLLVAIADVSHYVRPDSALDAAAYDRATSVYFPGRVVPMLPESLSNGLCSLVPGEPRLVVVCDMQVDQEGHVRRSRFYDAVIRSHARLTYDQVDALLFANRRGRANPAREFRDDLEHLRDVYDVLLHARGIRGALDFEGDEVRFEFDRRQKIAAIVPYQRTEAHRLIEECMIAANVCAARFLKRHKIGGLFRNHAGPSEDKLADLQSFLAEFGLRLAPAERLTSADYARIVERSAERSDASLIQTVLLRSLSQAVYQPRCTGHFGLALEMYAHFTSPIRRYPDLVVHRAIKHVVDGGNADGFVHEPADLDAFAQHCSFAERRADDATRDVASYLKCEYMQDKVGGAYEGIISGVAPFGVFVGLPELRVEGMVHVTQLPRDFYHFDAIAHRLEGERTGRRFRLGDPLRVRVVRVDLDDSRIEFAIEESGRRSSKHGRRRSR